MFASIKWLAGERGSPPLVDWMAVGDLHMDVKLLATNLLVFCLLPMSVLAAQVPTPTEDLGNFQTACLKSDQLCHFIDLEFSGDGEVRQRTVVFLPLPSRDAATFWNRKAEAKTGPDGSTGDARAAVYDTRTRAWKPLAAHRHCPLCVPATVQFHGKSTRWFRFETDVQARWRHEYSNWIFTRVIDRKDQDQLYVVVRSHDGPTVCASVRDSGMHYQYSTAKTGGFRVMLNSDWVRSERPDYVTISPVCSWQSLARRYMKMQNQALAGSGPLPTFTGTVQQKIDAAVGYIKSLGIRYDTTPDDGGYPRQDVTEILKIRRTDCKGVTTLLYALLRKSRVESHPVLLNAYGMTPLSFSVPDNWPDHAMLYVPTLGRYIDLTTLFLPGGGDKYTWQTSGDSYGGVVVFDLVTGRFGVVPSHLAKAGG